MPRNNVVGAFPGTQRELRLLRIAVAQNCTCQHQPPEPTDPVCSAHRMLGDLRVLQHLVFVRRKAAVYQYEEWDLDALDGGG